MKNLLRSFIIPLAVVLLAVVVVVPGNITAQTSSGGGGGGSNPVLDATVRMVNTPTLVLSYDSAKKEALLTGKFEFTVSAGTKDIYVHRQGAAVGIIDNSGGYVAVNSMSSAPLDPRGSLTTITDEYGQVFYVIDAGTTEQFTLVSTVNPKHLFAGSYQVSLASLVVNDTKLITNQTSMEAPSNKSNKVTVIGEVSPYISSITTPVSRDQKLVIEGVRLASSQLFIDGAVLANTMVVGDIAGTSLITEIPNYITDGRHVLYVKNDATGASNNVAFEVKSSSCFNFTKNLAIGSRGDEVTALQKLLVSQGYMVADDVSGYYGLKTYAAVRRYQTANGISATGFVGPETRARLNSMCSGPVTPTDSISSSFISAEEEVMQGDSYDTGTFTISFRVTAVNRDLYISKSSAYYGNAMGQFIYTFDKTGTPTPMDAATVRVSSSVSSSGESDDTAEYFAIEEGMSRTFVLTATLTPKSSSMARMTLKSIPFKINSPNSATFSDLPVDYSTGYTYLRGDPSITPTASCYTFSNNLQVGSTGADVIALQKLLIANGYNIPNIMSNLVAPGTYDEQTADAVRAFQKSQGIPDTGFVGPITRAALNALCDNPPPVPNVCPVGYICEPVNGAPGDPAIGCPAGFVCTLVGAPSITVLSPSGDTWVKGTRQQIKWTSNQITYNAPMAISLVRSGTTDNYDIASVYDRPLNSGVYEWEVGKTPEGSTMETDGSSWWVRVCVAETTICNTNADTVSGGKVKIDTGTANKSPVIHGGTFPTTLKVGQTGTWIIKASDPQNSSLGYLIEWGDTYVCPAGFVCTPTTPSTSNKQQSTFTHSYSSAGTYEIVITVTNALGLSAQTRTTVTVGDVTTTPSITVLSPKAGDKLVVGQKSRIEWSVMSQTKAGTFSITEFLDSGKDLVTSSVDCSVYNTGGKGTCYFDWTPSVASTKASLGISSQNGIIGYSGAFSVVITPNTTRKAQVRQLYLDLLRREPEQQGWDYWINTGLSVDEMKRQMMLGIEYTTKQKITTIFKECGKGVPHELDLTKWYYVAEYNNFNVEVVRQGLGCTTTVTQPSITVVSPNGGETFRAGDTIRINWRSSNVSRVVLDLFNESNSQLAVKNLVNVSGNPGSVDFIVSSYIEPGKYWLRVGTCAESVISCNTAGSVDPVTIYDKSDSYFTITSGTVTPTPVTPVVPPTSAPTPTPAPTPVVNTPTNLLTSFNQGSKFTYDTLNKSGSSITSAVESSANIGGAVSNRLSFSTAKTYQLSYTLTQNSGTAPNIRLVSGADGRSTILQNSSGARVLDHTAQSGTNVVLFTPSTTGGYIEISVGNGSKTDFSISDVTIQEVATSASTNSSYVPGVRASILEAIGKWFWR